MRKNKILVWLFAMCAVILSGVGINSINANDDTAVSNQSVLSKREKDSKRDKEEDNEETTKEESSDKEREDTKGEKKTDEKEVRDTTKGNENSDIGNPNPGKEIEGPWNESSFLFNGKAYTLPLATTAVAEWEGFKIDILGGTEEENVEGKNMISRKVYREFEDETVYIKIYNPSEETKPVSECVIVSIEVSSNAYRNYTSNFELTNGIKIGMSEKELNDIYKENTKYSYSKPIAYYQYGNKYDKYYSISLRKDKDVIYRFKVDCYWSQVKSEEKKEK